MLICFSPVLAHAFSASEMTYIVSGGALNSTNSTRRTYFQSGVSMRARSRPSAFSDHKQTEGAWSQRSYVEKVCFM